jgi:hypothetical protein
MKPLLYFNPTKTIALCEQCDNLNYLGMFDPILLQVWLQSVIENFGTEPVCLYRHSSNTPPNLALSAAMEQGDEMKIAVLGFVTKEQKTGG